MLGWVLRRYYQSFRIRFYRLLQDDVVVKGKPSVHQPVLFKGNGKINFGKNVNLGYNPSPGFFSEVSYIESRQKQSKIIFGENVYINNSCIIISDNGTISVGDNTIIGDHVRIMNSDFHSLNPKTRLLGLQNMGDVIIGRNVFIGSNVIINKGVEIGDNSIVGSGSVVSKNIEMNSIWAGNPAKFIRSL